MPSTELRQDVLTAARRVVVKVGSNVITNARGRLDARSMRRIADQIAALVRTGYAVTLVSSGAVAAGLGALRRKERPHDVGELQAVAAVGQSGLVQKWHELFKAHRIEVAQVLVTRGDFESRNRYLNFRNCLTHLHGIGAVPIINENDTVAVDEIRLGDNDILAALVTNALPADALVLLSVVDGLQDESGKVIELVSDVAAVRAMATAVRSSRGSGGMATKLEAARMAVDAGEVAVIANGRRQGTLLKVLRGEKVGTVFVPRARKLPQRQRWIGQAVRPTGTLVVDDGAVAALVERNKSLLAKGVTEVTGTFDKGDVVVVRDARGLEVARGLINYTASEARAIMGRRSDEFEAILGRSAYAEMIHVDNLVITRDRGGP